ncbi:MAG: hypothetical protein GYA23_05790 [Methanomicrobiales archaeon]|nr:hypothetical protein [Methanomicrobiales archaeon]
MIDVRIFAIGCVIGSLILAYLAWIRPQKDIVALSTPIYSFLFFVAPSDVSVTIFLELLYAVSLTILLIRLNLRFGEAPESGRSGETVLKDPLKSYCETVRGNGGEISHEVAHFAAVVFARFAQGEYLAAVSVADAATADIEGNSTFPALKTAFCIVREHAILLEESAGQPDAFLEFSTPDAGALAKPLPPQNKINDRFEVSLENALLLLFAAAWNGSEKDRLLLLNGQSFAQKLMQ